MSITPSDRVIPELGARRGILQVVSALGAAQKLKNISLGLRLQRSRQQDVGNFDITHCDEPGALEDEFADYDYPVPVSKQSGRATTSGTVETSSVATALAKPAQNTYRLEPSRKFDARKVREIIKRSFEEHLTGLSYQPDLANEKSRILADAIKERVKVLQFLRYKIVCLVNISQKLGQTVRFVSQCLWDSERDNYAQFSMENADLQATGIVYGIYLE